MLRLIADRAGLPAAAGGCFVSGGSAANLSALVVGREQAKRAARADGPGRRFRALVSADAHSSISNTLRILEMDPLVVHTSDHRLTGAALRAAIAADGDPGSLAVVVATAGTTNAGIVDDLAGAAQVAREHGLWFHVDGAYGGAGLFAPSVRRAYDGVEHADSFVVDPHKWLFAPFDCAALLYRDPALARAVHTQDASYLDVIHDKPGGVEPDRLRLPPDPAGPRAAAVVLAVGARGAGLYRGDRDGDPAGPGRPPPRSARRSYLELIREPGLGIVLFRRSGWAAAQYTAWADQLLRDQVAFLPPTAWEGETVARFAFLHPHTPMDLVRQILDRMK